MTAKKLLLSLKTEENRIRMIEEELSDVRNRMGSLKSPDYGSERVQNSSMHDELADYQIALENIEERHVKASREFVERRSEIYDLIFKLENPNYQRLLELRYIKGLTWERIAVEMGYSYQHVLRMHGYALLKVEDEIEC